MLIYFRNFAVGFFTGYLFAFISVYLFQWARAGFDFANIYVQGILMGILFGWIAGVINGAFCVQRLNMNRTLIGLFTGTVVFYIFLGIYT